MGGEGARVAGAVAALGDGSLDEHPEINSATAAMTMPGVRNKRHVSIVGPSVVRGVPARRLRTLGVGEYRGVYGEFPLADPYG
ncbi:hypothetical protein [Streptomyces zagrosensis]|uniref:Uncharacterized protein n=1 Tax=Streptomyces zagrosensis TaxID=1042984 RepID=A0A7W9QFY1_9ACTN|nr:hypothetical protein [Streptomyces zagrosensis]MBB5939550.1 hypothetical protein [Streptomyces zagrosensis]